MSRIQGGLSKNALERRVHNWLKASHYKHQMNPKMQGHPDVRIETSNGPLFVFIDGCFWHVCPEHYQRPKTRQEFWVPHVEESNARREVARAQLPYRWVRLWEHQVRDATYKAVLSNSINSRS